MIVKKFLAVNHEGILDDFNTIEEAREALKEVFYDSNEGYHPDLKSSMIYELKELVDYDVIKTREEFDEEELELYEDTDIEAIWKHKFISADDFFNKAK
jgi:hypothetical protein